MSYSNRGENYTRLKGIVSIVLLEIKPRYMHSFSITPAHLLQILHEKDYVLNDFIA